MAAELLTRIFTKEIQPLLFPSAMFINRALNDDAFVTANTVELPHAGALPNVAVDRAVIPAAVNKRTDVATNYQLEELTTDPTVIQDSEGMVVSYDKRASILSQHASQINTKACDRLLYKWGAGAANYIPTTGGNRAPQGPAQTGNRKKLVLDDIMRVKQKFHYDDVVPDNSPVQGVALLTPAMLSDLLSIQSIYDASQYGNPNLPNGVVARLLGFDIYVRSRVLVLNSSDQLKSEGAAGAATDQDAAFFWSPNYVRRAKSGIKVYVNVGEATMYGDVMSTMMRLGGAAARNDNKGVYILFEDNN